MERQARRDTAAEISIRKRLFAAGYRYRVDYRLPGTRRRADIAFPRRKLAIFVDGCFWHLCPDHMTWPKNNAAWWRRKLLANQRRDLETDALLQQAGWSALRIWEHEDAEAAARRITAALTVRAGAG
jgi:DNA mismatch endonuclease (patch repair protein)